MKGYKGFDSDLTCRGFQYKIGETFTMNEPISWCGKGYHFCTSLSDTFKFYNPVEDNVFCEIEASGEIKKGDGKCVCSEIKIIKKIPKSFVNRTCYGIGNGSGIGYGNDYGDGYGNGFGFGDGIGIGNGSGNGSGNDYGDGYGNGYGAYGTVLGGGYGNGGGGYGIGFGYKANIHNCIVLK